MTALKETGVEAASLEVALATYRYMTNKDVGDINECIAATIAVYLKDTKLDEARDRIEQLERQLATARTALTEIATDLQSAIDTHEFNARHMIAEDSLQDAWKMLDMAREQFQVDANSLRIPLARARSLQSEGGKP